MYFKSSSCLIIPFKIKPKGIVFFPKHTVDGCNAPEQSSEAKKDRRENKFFSNAIETSNPLGSL